ncbi:SubName: Full=Uncharacterized protein {ECO:0000313/EMBL:CCA68278.1} [Serendipita indica DSM 11827]|uniref:FHA domain-containing protein n=1 Tax=Serendipita indica (strain DSM 11827) TaxID=1109443 RepID=G4TAC8_SERID|nr:SubName: Full=Uncharacterized protein {ECO:0000313/EMBL:CCA68278.1} [Serendipita indica DSM 11827]CCA68278.1 hypothetical protein PIIN_02142 [Serendipita indica DSM 11827]
MATRNSNSSATGDKDSYRGINPAHSTASISLIPKDSDEPPRVFSSSVNTITIGRYTVDGKTDSAAAQSTYLTTCPVVSRTHATIRWLHTGDVVIADSESHHGTYINDSLARLTPGQAYKLQDDDIISFGKGIFKDGNFHPPHTVLVRFNAPPSSPTKSRSGTYGLTSRADPTRLSSIGSPQSEVTDRQAERIRTEVQRLGRRREAASRHKRQLHDVSARLEYLEKSAMDKASPQDVDVRLRALERHYESLLEKLTNIEQSLRTPDQDNGSITSERRRKHKQSDDGEETDDDEPAVAPKAAASTSSTLGTVAMVLAGVAVTYTALAMS